ncbi:MAG: glycosyltransferase family 2 protein, partial [Sulfitobacter sp.]
MNDLRLSWPDPQLAKPPVPPVQLGQYLVEKGLISRSDLTHALDLQRRIDAPLGEIMISEGLVTSEHVLDALSSLFGIIRVDPTRAPPDPKMAGFLPAAVCLEHGVLPYAMQGDTVLVATSRPGQFEHLRACMGPRGAHFAPVIADELAIQTQLSRLYGETLAFRAARRVHSHESCRNWGKAAPRGIPWLRLFAVALVGGLIAAPLWTITIAMLWATLTLAATTCLKTASFWARLRRQKMAQSPGYDAQVHTFRLPRVSILVPLFREKEIAQALIARLTQLTYPKSLLNIVLVLEAEDRVTRDTLERTNLPPWMSVIEVPGADNLTTKPRALNYALDFCRGSIIGVWDAEDWPEADQIERVVTRFQAAPDNVACLQGVLDYYNPRANWLARCFTIEYATWWRVILPGMARLGLVIPLGGTTLFFRRDILEKLCGWDAHNVTEDADLGVRLARHGYVTELIPTVTHEEANCRTWPWIRQRSRWLKGFMITYLVHMRDPGQLLRDLGMRRFLGLQTIFLATFSQFFCAPLLWSFWIALFGVTHP